MNNNKPLVLVVEDDVLARMVLAQQIQDAGFEVIEASNARDAIAVLESGVGIYAAVSDIQMPGGLDGLDLALYMAVHHPSTKVVLTSGTGAAIGGRLPAGVRFLAKPYEIRQLTAALQGFVLGYAG